MSRFETIGPELDAANLARHNRNLDRADSDLTSQQQQISAEQQSRMAADSAHASSVTAHPAQNITYSGAVAGATNVKQAIDAQDARINNIVAGAGSSNTEIVDARPGLDGVAHPVLRDRLDRMEQRQLSSQNQSSTINRGPNVINSDQASGATFKVLGRTLANIVPPVLGRCEDAAAWTNSGVGTIEVSNSIYREGNGSMKVMASADYFPWRSINYHLDKAKTYFLGCWIYLENVGGGAPRVSITDSNSPTPIRYNAVANTSIVGQWQFCFARIPTNNVIATDNGFRLFLMSYGGPCTFYVDSIRIYELTADEYNAIGTIITGEAIDRRWPYVDSVQHTQGLSVAVAGKNILKGVPDTVHAFAVVNGPYNLTLNATESFQQSTFSVPAIAGQSYSFAYESGTFLGEWINAAGARIAYWQAGGYITSGRTETAPAGTVRLRIQASNTGAGIVVYKNWVLVLGDASNLPDSFTPYNPQYAHAPIKLASNVDRTIADSYDSATGEVFRRWVLGAVIDGLLQWAFVDDQSGFKRIRTTNAAIGPTWVTGGGRMVKYNGAIIPSGTTATSPDVHACSGDGSVYISVADADSGWTESINPNVNAIKALANGWKANGNNGTVYNSWSSILTGAAPVTNTEAYVAANKAPGWEAYARLDYVRANPVTEQLSGDLGGLSVVKGGNAVELLEGVIVREKATVSYNPNGAGFYRINVTGHPSYTPNSPLSRRAASILCVYKDNLPDDRWSFPADPYAYGSVVAQIPAANYDPAADYFVDYIVLDKYVYTANVVDATLTYQSTQGSVIAQNVQDIAAIKTHDGVQDWILAQYASRLLALEEA